jgi:bacteriorhodopsin
VTFDALWAGEPSLAHSLEDLKPSGAVSDFTDKNLIEALQYGKYYNAFFAAGMAALVVLVGLMSYMAHKRLQRTNPIGIMFNLLLI